MPKKTYLIDLPVEHPFHQSKEWDNCGDVFKTLTTDAKSKDRLGTSQVRVYKFKSRSNVTALNGTDNYWQCTICWKPIGIVKKQQFFCDAYCLMDHFLKDHSPVTEITDNIQPVKSAKPVKNYYTSMKNMKLRLKYAKEKGKLPSTPDRPSRSATEFNSPGTEALFNQLDQDLDSDQVDDFLDADGYCEEELAKRAQEDAAKVCDIDPDEPLRPPPGLFSD